MDKYIYSVTTINLSSYDIDLMKDDIRATDFSCYCMNVWETEEDARNSLLTNHFDVWEGFTCRLAVIEKMVIGQPWTTEQVAWFCVKEINEVKEEPLPDGTLCSRYEPKIVEVKQPKAFEGICNLGIG